jgi:hypothetical protein
VSTVPEAHIRLHGHCLSHVSECCASYITGILERRSDGTLIIVRYRLLHMPVSARLWVSPVGLAVVDAIT